MVYLQRQTGGGIQRFKPPSSFSIKLQQVRVILPVREGGGGPETLGRVGQLGPDQTSAAPHRTGNRTTSGSIWKHKIKTVCVCTDHREGLCVIDSRAIPASFAAWKMFPSTSMLTALVHSSSRAYRGLGERHPQHRERERERESDSDLDPGPGLSRPPQTRTTAEIQQWVQTHPSERSSVCNSLCALRSV